MGFFSIITPTCNAGGCISRCLASVAANAVGAGADSPAASSAPPGAPAASSPCGVEHIIVDNLSCDGTPQLVRKFAPQALVISEADGGIYDALNKGLRAAHGEVVACLNADDWYTEGALARVRAAFADHRQADIVHGNILVCGREVRPPRGLASFGGARIFHPAAFIRRELLARLGGFDATYLICADLDFFLRARAAGAHFVHIDVPLTNFSLGGLSTVQRRQTALELRRALVSNGRGVCFANFYYALMRLRAGVAWMRGRGLQSTGSEQG